MLCSYMNYFNDELDNIEEILKVPYIFEKLDEEEVNYLFDQFVPEKMYVIYHSQLVKEEQAANPESFTMERFYSKYFTIE